MSEGPAQDALADARPGARADARPGARADARPGARLAGRRILVVGAGTQPGALLEDGMPDPDAPAGNGRAISVLAAREGASVACVDRDRPAAEATANLVRATAGDGSVAGAGAAAAGGTATGNGTATAFVIQADVSTEEGCARAVAEAVDQLGGIDGIVLNVGIGRGGRLAGTSAEDWDATFAVNVRSHFLICREALPLLPEGSSIVFISSVAGLKPGSRIPAYDSSKAALAGLCRHVAAEGARHGARANVVAPGLIDTPLGRWASVGRPSRERTPVPLGRQGTAWEVGEVVVFLLSRAASYVTGQVIAVDGGLSTLV